MTVLTVFGGSEQSTDAENALLTKLLGLWGIDSYKSRRSEDSAAMDVLGATPIHLDFPELLQRNSIATSVDQLLSSVESPEDDARIVEQIASAVADYVQACDILYVPWVEATHPDHVLVSKSAAFFKPTPTFGYEDIPYPRRNVRNVRNASRSEFEPSHLESKLRACSCYRSQIGVLFGSETLMRQRLRTRASANEGGSTLSEIIYRMEHSDQESL